MIDWGWGPPSDITCNLNTPVRARSLGKSHIPVPSTWSEGLDSSPPCPPNRHLPSPAAQVRKKGKGRKPARGCREAAYAALIVQQGGD